VEAAAYGNVLVQARTAGVLTGGLAELRRLLSSTTTYLPRSRSAG
jgi:rhamnulokinase